MWCDGWYRLMLVNIRCRCLSVTSLSWKTSDAAFSFLYAGKENDQQIHTHTHTRTVSWHLLSSEQTTRPIKGCLAPASIESVEFVEKFGLCCLWFQACQVETWWNICDNDSQLRGKRPFHLFTLHVRKAELGVSFLILCNEKSFESCAFLCF